MKKKANITAVWALVAAAGLYGLVSTSSGATPQRSAAEIAARQAQLEQQMAAIMPPAPVATSTKKGKAKATTLVASTSLKAPTPSLKSNIETPLGQNYTVVDLGDLGGGGSYAWDINENGDVVGNFVTEGYPHAFAYINGVTRNLGTLGGNSSVAYGINDSGQIVGKSTDASNANTKAFVITNSVMQDLNDLSPGWMLETAMSVNNGGVIIGLGGPAAHPHDCYVFDHGTTTDIGEVTRFPFNAKINAKGEIALTQFTTITNSDGSIGQMQPHAFLYSNNAFHDLGSITGTNGYSAGYGINDAGQVVGNSSVDGNRAHAILYTDGAMEDIDTFDSGSSVAYGINNSGQVVGTYKTASSSMHAFLYSGGQMQDLNSLVVSGNSGWTLVRANAINNVGEIVGYGINPAGQTHAFKLKPLPLGSTQAIENQPAQPVFSTPFAKEPGKDNLIVITHGWNPSWNEQDTTWIDSMSNSISVYLASLGMTNWQVNGYKWVPRATMISPVSVGLNGVNDDLLNNARMEGNHLGFSLARQGWEHVHFIGHSAGSELIQQACEVVKDYSTAFSSVEVPPTVHCTFLDPFIGSHLAGLKSYGARADWSDSYYTRDIVTGTFTEGCLSNAFNVDVTQLDTADQKIALTMYHSTPTGAIEPCRVTLSDHHWPIDFYLNTITGNTVTPDYSVFGITMSLEGGGFWVAKDSCPTGNIPAHVLGTPDPVCFPEIRLTPKPHADVVADLIGWPSEQSATVPANKGYGFLTLYTASPAWLAAVVDSTNMLNTVSFDAQFVSGQGAQGLLSVYWDADTIGYVDERMVSPELAHYTFTFPNAKANTAHVLGFRLDPFTNIQSIVVITNIALNVIGPTEPFMLSVTTNKVGGLPVFQLNGEAGYEYGVQMSTNLAGTNWTYIASLVNTNGVVNFYDPDSSASAMRFYRAVWVP